MSAEPGELCRTDSAIVQGTGQQYATCSRGAGRVQICNIPDTAREEQPCCGVGRSDSFQQSEVRPFRPADMAEVHQYEIVRVTRRVGRQAGRVAQSPFVEIDRKDRNTAWQRAAVQPGLGTDNGTETYGLAPGVYIDRAAEPGIDPQFQRRIQPVDFAQQCGMATHALDSIEIRQVQEPAAEIPVKDTDQRQDGTVMAQGALHRAIAITLSLPGVNGKALR